MVRFRRALVALVATAGALILPPVTSASARADQFDPTTQKAIETIAQGTLAYGVPGIAVGIWVPGHGTYVRAFGTANLVTGAPFRIDDHVRIGSITKMFVATEVLRLVDKGRLTLNDHLDRYVGGIAYGNEITIRELLNHTSGVFNYTDDPTWIANFDKNPLEPFTPQDVIAIVNKPGNNPTFVPGTPGAWAYSDTNYILLGLVIEKLTGKPANEVIQRDVVDRLDLDHTSFPSTSPAIPHPLARGYLLPTSLDVTAIDPAIAWTAGGMISNLKDLKVLAKASATGTLLSPDLQRERLQTVATNQGSLPSSYGLGIFNVAGFLGHSGAIYGYGTTAFYLPSADATIVVVSNAASNSSEGSAFTFLELASLLFPDQFK